MWKLNILQIFKGCLFVSYRWRNFRTLISFETHRPHRAPSYRGSFSSVDYFLNCYLFICMILGIRTLTHALTFSSLFKKPQHGASLSQSVTTCDAFGRSFFPQRHCLVRRQPHCGCFRPPRHHSGTHSNRHTT